MYQMPFVSTAVRVDHEDGWVVAFNLRDHFAADKGNERKIVYLSTPMEEDPTEVPPGTKKKYHGLAHQNQKKVQNQQKVYFLDLKVRFLKIDKVHREEKENHQRKNALENQNVIRSQKPEEDVK